MIRKYKKNIVKQTKFNFKTLKFDLISAKLEIRQDKELQRLDFIQNLKITDLQIQQCQNVILDHLNINSQKISITMCNLQNISGIESLTDCKQLNMYDNVIEDINPVRNLLNLKSFLFANNRITDLRPISKLLNIQHLILQANQLTDISPLQNLLNLSWLDVTKNKIIDLSSLRELVKITVFECEQNQILDVSSLSAHDFKILNVKNNFITDFSPLQHQFRFGLYQIESQTPPSTAQKLFQKRITFINQMTLKRQQTKQQTNLGTKMNRTKQKIRQYVSEMEQSSNYLIQRAIFAIQSDCADQ
ncbi:Conserved_hypothetical protein [Hexamita inflata]|uniref:Uncharacterized protein n=1 Tax=Hexamita inflata TaxID=28002 RepID=A0AA86UB54_9EUKA|nr:Conserved hypothetical protein [Hexamita inflata]